jgi:undecaprenyl diphosphate synthase
MKNLNHLAVIMDGNSRWASSRNLPSKQGHKEGVKKARLAVEYALENKIDYLTLFAFSTENWLRDEVEVRDLISLFFEALEEQTPELREEKVKLNFIGDISRFNKKLLKQIEKSKKLTEEYKPKLNLIIAASY